MMQKMKRDGLVLIAHNVRSAHNVGALFRTADGAGVTKVFLTGYTPRPYVPKKNAVDDNRRYVTLTKAEKELAKTALGAEMSMRWTRMTSVKKALATLRREKYTVVGLEQSATSYDYREYAPVGPLALVVGNEVRGLDPAILKQCDAIIAIPMRGTKNSLNVAVATGIALYQIANIMENNKRSNNEEYEKKQIGSFGY